MPERGAGLTHKGVNYDVGTEYSPGRSTRTVWRTDLVRAELREIAEDLHCNAVCVYGTDIDRLGEAAEIAQENGLAVWLQPRLTESGPTAYLAHLDRAADLAERLRGNDDRVVLNVGCEMTVFNSGLMPGDDYNARTDLLSNPLGWVRFPQFNRRLNALLARAASTARDRFGGTLTYSAALWESVDWTPFDVIGVNHYRLSYNARRYLPALRRYYRHGKPVVVTEFGCGSHDGADLKGPSSHAIVDWSGDGPVLADPPARNEEVQAGYITELIDIFADEELHGAFVFEFVEPYNPHDPADPRHDLDRAGYGLVKVHAEDAARPYSSGHRERKAAFDAVAKRYASM